MGICAGKKCRYRPQVSSLEQGGHLHEVTMCLSPFLFIIPPGAPRAGHEVGDIADNAIRAADEEIVPPLLGVQLVDEPCIPVG
jgi:hypothetical protein